jgi:hypothetical protein
MGKSEMHTLIIPLEASQRDIHIVSGAMGIVGKLRNAVLGEMLNRVDQMRQDTRWQDAAKIFDQKKKGKAYQELRKDYGITAYDVVGVCHKHWKASRWMENRIGARIAIALAAEILQNLDEYIYGRAKRPRFKPSYERNTVWNSDNKSGLLLRDGHIKWSINTKRKCLGIPLDMHSISVPRRQHLEGRLAEGGLRRVGIKREMIRGEMRLFAIICLEGAPYRSADYLSTIDRSNRDIVGLDLGPTWLAVVAEGEAKEMPIATLERIQQDKAMRLKERNLKRAADRSRKASNLHARRKDSRSIKGVRQPQRSKRGQQRQQWLDGTKRKDRINRQKDRINAVRQVTTSGIHISLEELNYKSWQRSFYGKRTLITAPGDFTVRLQREAEMLGGSVYLVDPRQARASQTCLCGKHVGKKPLKERIHSCPYCGLEAHRDMVSAALVRELRFADKQVWDEGLASASRTKHAAIEAILSSCRTPSSHKTASGKRGVKQSTESSAAKVLLCEKQASDPGLKNRKSSLGRGSHVPTCEKPAAQRLGATRKATVKQTEDNPPLVSSD